MGFNLRNRPTSFQYIVKGQTDQIPFRFVGVYKTLTTEQSDIYLAKIASLESDLREGINAFTAIAKELFLGWVNLPGDPSTWVREGGPDSEPVECSPTTLAEMLSHSGICRAVCLGYFDAINNDTARLGNSQVSPEPGVDG